MTTVNVNTQPILCHYGPRIRLQQAVLYKCVLIVWLTEEDEDDDHDDDDNNNNNSDNIYGAVIVAAEPLREFTQFMWWIWHGAKRPPTFRPGQTTRADSACRLPEATPTIAIIIIIITQPESRYSFYHPAEGRRLSRPRHCSKGV